VPYCYYTRDAQVLYALSKDIAPHRPERALVTDRQWAFMQRCWVPVNAPESRPLSKEIVKFAKEELVEINEASL
jgi:hypothetical protein